MANDPITERQGDEIIRLLEKILAELREIKSSAKAIQSDAFDSESHLRSIELHQR